MWGLGIRFSFESLVSSFKLLVSSLGWRCWAQTWPLESELVNKYI